MKSSGKRNCGVPFVQILSRLLDIFQQWFRSPYFGFIQGHGYLTLEELRRIEVLLYQPDNNVVHDFEAKFASLVGEGQAVTYATGRMGFFELMRVLGIGARDEVILLGATCAAMVNAVLRIGATPVFSDIDPDTFGSSAEALEKCINTHTRMIVAQHSFGIPCDIKPILELARSRNIFLLEDCALTLGSKVNGITVGNFGDAALFSTDHSKPINCLIGGLIYTHDAGLAEQLRRSQVALPELSVGIQKALWHRLHIERRNCLPDRYGRFGVIDLLLTVRQKLLSFPSPFLAADFNQTSSTAYPFPARFPAFLAALGLIEINRWSQMVVERKALFCKLLYVAQNSSIRHWLPKAYSNSKLDIVPLRFVWSQPNGDLVRNLLEEFIQVSWTWFMKPIISTKLPLEDFGYVFGSCAISERVGFGMVNIPCNVNLDFAPVMIGLFKEKLKYWDDVS